MNKSPLKNTDLKLSAICFGTAGFGDTIDKQTAFDLLDRYIDAGGNFIDTGAIYARKAPDFVNRGERIIGEWLHKGGNRNRAIVATKGGHYDPDHPQISRVTEAEVRKDLEESLRTFGAESVDLYWLHRDNEDVPIEEIIDFLEKFRAEGKIRYYGASNYRQERIERAVAYADEKGINGFSILSNQWSLASANPGAGIIPDPSMVIVDQPYYDWHVHTGTPLVPFSSAAFGYFQKLADAGIDPVSEASKEEVAAAIGTAMAGAYYNERNQRVYRKLSAISKETGESLHALSVAALRSAPFETIPIASARTITQLDAVLRAGEIELEENVTDIFGPA